MMELKEASTKQLLDELKGREGVPDFRYLGPDDMLSAVEVHDMRGPPQASMRPEEFRWTGPCIIVRIID